MHTELQAGASATASRLLLLLVFNFGNSVYRFKDFGDEVQRVSSRHQLPTTKTRVSHTVLLPEPATERRRQRRPDAAGEAQVPGASACSHERLSWDTAATAARSQRATADLCQEPPLRQAMQVTSTPRR